MRKDLRIGLGIGGVLLAVLIVALVVRSNSNKNKVAQGDPSQVQPTPPETPPQDPGPSVVPPADPTAPPATPPGGISTEPPAVPPTPPTDPFAGPPGGAAGRTAWGSAFSGEGAAISSTPLPGMRAVGGASGGGSSSGIGTLEHETGATGGSTGTRADDAAVSRPPAGSSTSSGATSGGSRTAVIGARNHVIQQGESFSSIARLAYGDARYYYVIQKGNPNVNPNALKPGSSIVIPEFSPESRAPASTSGNGTGNGSAPRTATPRASSSVPIDSRTEYRVESGDSLHRICQKLYGNTLKVNALYELNKNAIGPDPARLKLNMVLKLPQPPTSAR